jgi:chondroitin AC lyase
MSTYFKIILVCVCFFLSSTAVLTADPGKKRTGSKAAIRSVADSDLETIRLRIILDLQQPEVNKEEVLSLVKTIRADGTWPGINYIDTSRTGFEHRIHLENMLTLARAISKKGSPFLNDAATKNALGTALDYWLRNDFRCQNWWWNEMGTPQLMINILMLMDTNLTENQKSAGLKIAHRANLETFGARPGGDLLPIAGMLGKQALFTRDEVVLERVISVMASEIKITTDRGIKPDLSFHHRTDNVISTLTYGTNFANSFAYWAVKISGTRFKLPEEATRLLIDYFLDGICKSMVYGIYPDPGAENRDMTRMNALKAAGSELPENLRKISDYRSKEVDEIIRLRKGLARPSLVSDRFFWHSSYLVHQRPTYFVSVRMHSSRASNMEQPHNEEGLKMHHFGDGSNFISRRGDEYLNIYPVWDWQKIPGATILQKADVAHWNEVAKKGKSEFSGGVSNGVYGVVAIDLVSVHDPLKAKKAWFLFDKEYVCLGTDITTDSDLPVYTTLNQTLLKNDVVVSDANGKSTLEKGDHNLHTVKWILHDSVGYLFPAPADLKLLNHEVTGNWRQINHQSWATTDPVKKDVFAAWLDHGKKATNASYMYLVVPNATSGILDSYMADADIKVVSNTNSLQAVTNRKSGVTQAVFYQPGTVEFPGFNLSVKQPSIVMVDKDALAISDPTQKLEKIILTINRKINGTGENFKAGWDESKKITTLEVVLPKAGMAGSSVIIPFRK